MTRLPSALRAASALLLVGLAGCIATPADLPDDAVLTCAVNEECPPGWVCRAAVGRCFDSADLDETPPAFGGSPTLSPTLLKEGDVLRVEFTVSEDLREPPVVSIDERPLVRVEGEEAPEPPAFVYTYAASGEEPEGTGLDVKVTLRDESGLDATLELSEVRFDFTPPEVAGEIAVSPADPLLALDEELEISFTASEPLATGAPPVARLVNTRAGHEMALLLEEEDGGDYRFGAAPSDGLPPGGYQVVLELVDEAGNEAFVLGPEVTLDVVAPSVVDARLRYEPGPGNPITGSALYAATVGTGVNLAVAADEELDPLSGASIALRKLLGLGPDNEPQLGEPVIVSSFEGFLLQIDGQSVQVQGTIEPGTPGGLYFPEITWTDLAGNTATELFTAEERLIWVKKGASPLAVDHQQVAVVVAPWGTSEPEVFAEGSAVESSLPAGPYTLVGPADPLLATSSTIPRAAFRFDRDEENPIPDVIEDPVAFLTVYLDQEGPAIGTLSPTDQLERWQRVELPPLPTDRIFVAGVDVAGNVSRRVQLRNVEWVAHPGTSSFLGVPNPVLTSGRATAAIAVEEEVTGALTSAASPAPVAFADALSARTGRAFRVVDPAGDGTPLPSSTAAVAYDAWRDRVVLFGGDPGGTDQARTWEWDGRHWHDVTPDQPLGPTPRELPGLVFDQARGRTVLFGGTVEGYANPRDLWEWNGELWQRVTPAIDPALPEEEQLPAGRFGHGMIYDDKRGRVIVYGGVTYDDESPDPECTLANIGELVPLCDLWSFDGQTWTRLPLSEPHPGARLFVRFGYDKARDRYVLYRGTDSSDPGAESSDVWETDPEAGTWARVDLVETADAPFETPLSAPFYDEALDRLVAPSFRGGGEYHLRSWTGAGWEDGPSLGPAGPEIRELMLGAYDRVDEVAFVSGGFALLPPDDTLDVTFQAGSEGWSAYPPATGAYPAPRSHSSFAWIPARQRAVLFGGAEAILLTGFSGAEESMLEWDGRSWTETPAPADVNAWPGQRAGAGLATDLTTGAGVLFGGASGLDDEQSPAVYEYRGGTWILDETGWTEAAPLAEPPLRVGHAMAPAPQGGVILFGGAIGTPAEESDDTWIYDEGTAAGWTQPSPVLSPPARVGAAMAYDEGSDVVVLYGGLADGPLADTWLFDGATWTLAEAASAPGPRAYAAMAYDAARERVVLHGGVLPAEDELIPYRDLWEWDGAGWVRVEGGQHYRFSHAMTYDPEREELLLTSGQSENGVHQSVLYARPSAADEDRPAITFFANKALAAFALDQIRGGRVRGRCAGTGSGLIPGARLQIWSTFPVDGAPPGWTDLDENVAGEGATLPLFDVTLSQAQAQRALLGRSQAFAVRCTTRQAAGDDVAEVAASFFEIRIRYEAPIESACEDGLDNDQDDHIDGDDLDCANP